MKGTQPARDARARRALEAFAKGDPVGVIAARLSTSQRTIRRYVQLHRQRIASDAEAQTLTMLQRIETRTELMLRILLERIVEASTSKQADANYQLSKLCGAAVAAMEAHVRIGLRLGSLQAVRPAEELAGPGMVESLGFETVSKLCLVMAQIDYEETARDARPDVSVPARAHDVLLPAAKLEGESEP